MQTVAKAKLPELLKYLAIGLVTNLVDFLLYGLLLLLTGNFLLAENLKTPVILAFNYFAHRVFTFKSTRSRTAEIGRYLAANLAIWLFANTTLILLVTLLGLLFGGMNDDNTVQIAAKLCQLAIVPVFSYLLLKLFVYRNVGI